MASLNGFPERIRLDNGPEFTPKTFTSWALIRGIQLDYTRPGKPTNNCYIESFNGKLRDKCLNENWFTTIKEVRATIRSWLTDYT